MIAPGFPRRRQGRPRRHHHQSGQGAPRRHGPLFHSQEVAGICLSNWKRTRLLQVACPLRILRAKAKQTCGGRGTLSGWMCVVIAHLPAITGSNSGKMLDRIPDPEVNSDDMAADCLAGRHRPQVHFATRDSRLDFQNSTSETGSYPAKPMAANPRGLVSPSPQTPL